MPSIIVKITRDQHRQVKRDAKEKGKTISDHVRDRLRLGAERGESARQGGTKRDA